ncbi:MAG: hypothetical protein KGZ77_08095, partial [Rhodobacteraceae bacterium]|nr:hypothetical protein [Paracoccaceae bacterium]
MVETAAFEDAPDVTERTLPGTLTPSCRVRTALRVPGAVTCWRRQRQSRRPTPDVVAGSRRATKSCGIPPMS